ncbi:hypothetical protein D3C80_2002860 [compost metagenome]
MQETVTMARGTAENVIDRRPAPEFKDWNDQIQGKVWSNAEAKIDERREEVHAIDLEKGAKERAARAAEQEAARKRREEEAKNNQPTGPRR